MSWPSVPPWLEFIANLPNLPFSRVISFFFFLFLFISLPLLEPHFITAGRYYFRYRTKNHLIQFSHFFQLIKYQVHIKYLCAVLYYCAGQNLSLHCASRNTHKVTAMVSFWPHHSRFPEFDGPLRPIDTVKLILPSLPCCLEQSNPACALCYYCTYLLTYVLSN